jgi:23S rRNA (adenine2030-N6)-methyltransferase
MLSYQHIYHAGNLADVHKHALLSSMLKYLTAKDKPFTYFETHAGRAVYDLDADEALKTGEAAKGVGLLRDKFKGTAYGDVLAQTTETHGKTAYPGSPLIAATLLRETDKIHLCELHPGEHAALDYAMSPYPVSCHNRDGFATAHSLLPPTPRRGMMLIDPSYEIKTDYDLIPGHIRRYARSWNVGIIALWYPILMDGSHTTMLRMLEEVHPDAMRHEVRFTPAKQGHGMIGSGMFIINAPYGTDTTVKHLTKVFAPL